MKTKSNLSPVGETLPAYTPSIKDIHYCCGKNNSTLTSILLRKLKNGDLYVLRSLTAQNQDMLLSVAEKFYARTKGWKFGYDKREFLSAACLGFTRGCMSFNPNLGKFKMFAENLAWHGCQQELEDFAEIAEKKEKDEVTGKETKKSLSIPESRMKLKSKDKSQPYSINEQDCDFRTVAYGIDIDINKRPRIEDAIDRCEAQLTRIACEIFDKPYAKDLVEILITYGNVTDFVKEHGISRQAFYNHKDMLKRHPEFSTIMAEFKQVEPTEFEDELFETACGKLTRACVKTFGCKDGSILADFFIIGCSDKVFPIQKGYNLSEFRKLKNKAKKVPEIAVALQELDSVLLSKKNDYKMSKAAA